jgi:hypothetical protein
MRRPLLLLAVLLFVGVISTGCDKNGDHRGKRTVTIGVRGSE